MKYWEAGRNWLTGFSGSLLFAALDMMLVTRGRGNMGDIISSGRLALNDSLSALNGSLNDLSILNLNWTVHHASRGNAWCSDQMEAFIQAISNLLHVELHSCAVVFCPLKKDLAHSGRTCATAQDCASYCIWGGEIGREGLHNYNFWTDCVWLHMPVNLHSHKVMKLGTSWSRPRGIVCEWAPD